MVGECHGKLDVTQSQESPRRVPSVVGLAGNDLVHLPISKGHRLPAWPSGSCSHSPQPWPCPNHSIPDGPSASLLPPLGHLQPHPKPLIRGGPNGSLSLLCPPPDSQAQEMFMHTPPHPLVHTPCHTVLAQSIEPVPETDACLILSTGHLPSWASVSRFSTLGHPKPQRQPSPIWEEPSSQAGVGPEH